MTASPSKPFVSRGSTPFSEPRSPPTASVLAKETRDAARRSSGVLARIPPSKAAGPSRKRLHSALPEDDRDAKRIKDVSNGIVPDSVLLNDDGRLQLASAFWANEQRPESLLFSCQPLGAASDMVLGPSGSVHGVLPMSSFKLDGAKHKIFLSHAGAQKGFVEQLCVDLEKKGYFFPFFDMPKGEDFGPLIIEAARLCHVAVIVLSEEYLCSKWPMIELTEFYAAQQGARGGGVKLKLLPLFFKLSIEEVKDEGRWMPKWKEHATSDDQINLSQWSAAVKALCKSNGLDFGKVGRKEVAYRKCVVESIFNLSPPNLQLTFDRMCEAMATQFVEDTTVGARVLGVYGMAGLGKTMLAKALHNYFYEEFLGKVCYIDMRNGLRAQHQDKMLKLLFGFEKDDMAHIDGDVEKQLMQMKMFKKREPVFLVLDNITNDANLLQEVRDYLNLGFHFKSRILITSSSKAVLEDLLPNMKFYMPMPTLMVKDDGQDFSKIKEVEHPQLGGLHALIQAVPKPQVEEILMIPEAIVGPVGQDGGGSWKVTPSRFGSDADNLLLTSLRSWDPTEAAHIQAVKKALHLSAIPPSVLCRDVEQEKVISFCKSSILQQVPGSMYVCGCPGTGKSLTMEQVKLLSVSWAAEANLPSPDIVSVNCTTLTDPRNIYQTVLQALRSKESSDDTAKSWSVTLKELKQRVCDTSRRSAGSPKRMLLMIVDEMDYLITRNQEVLYDLFQLPTYPNSCCILMGIANAIDLTDRFLPKLRSMNCKPDVVTFPAYTKDQILTVLTQRLKGIPFPVFNTAALELCARKVAAATGDMRKALHVCRSALDILETEVRAELGKDAVDLSTLNESEPTGLGRRSSSIKPPHLVQIDHMAKALARTFRSPVVETIQNLPQHQQVRELVLLEGENVESIFVSLLESLHLSTQMVLCSAVRLFRRAKKDATLGELNKAYLDFCKSSSMPALAGSEFSSMCRVLADQALLKLGESREDRLRRVTLQVNQDDVVFALQAVRFFRNSLS